MDRYSYVRIDNAYFFKIPGVVVCISSFLAWKIKLLPGAQRKNLTESVSLVESILFQFQLSGADSDSDSGVSFFSMTDSDSDSSSNGVDFGGIEHKLGSYYPVCVCFHLHCIYIPKFPFLSSKPNLAPLILSIVEGLDIVKILTEL